MLGLFYSLPVFFNSSSFYLSLDLIKRIIYYVIMDTFTALSDPTRRHIVEMLASSGRLSASDISHKFNVSSPAISQHLKVLREAKLVDVEKKAQKRMYQINPEKLREIEVWAKRLTTMWNERFDILDQLLKKEKDKFVAVTSVDKRRKG